MQVPVWQVSLPLQRSPSGQAAPSASGVFWQPVAGVHVSRVQAFASSHASGAVSVVERVEAARAGDVVEARGEDVDGRRP